MNDKYREFTGLNLPSIEKEILLKWQQTEAFEKSVSLREGAKPFVFYEGPPSANGMPGIHHVMARTLKDMVCRYKTMQGFQVKRKGGWDTHGLPVEIAVEKELGITKEDIGKKISVEDYNQKCREAVLRYKDKWDELTIQMGYWVDLNDPYITFDNKYIETLWWLLSELYKKELLFESVSIQPYSPAAGTGLSNAELNQPGCYKDVKDTSCVAMFKAVKDEKSQFLFDAAGSNEVFFLAWTTTPWTLPSNLGLAVGPNIDYVLVKTFNLNAHLPANVILAKSLLDKYFKDEGRDLGYDEYKEGNKIIPWKIAKEFKGSEIENSKYEQLLSFEGNSIAVIEEETPGAKPFRVLLGDFVTTEDGTGIVHTAPAFGADDFRVGKKNNIGILTMVDKRGRFLPGIKDDVFLYGEEYVKEEYLTEKEKESEFIKQKQILEANNKVKDLKKYLSVDDRIVLKLQEEGRLFKKEKYDHSYPHCWRTDKPILYYPLDAWFIKTTALKDRMVALNKTINWKPKSTGEGRFGNWLENMVDWNLSRSRYWGTPLPVWRTEDGGEETCVGSIAELNEGIRKANEVLGNDVNKHYLHGGILDLHKPYVDEIILASLTGRPMKRVPDLIDVWFDSGAMPYAQHHFPFENKHLFADNYPADFIAEGVDQTRGWFYTLHAIGSLIKESVHDELKKAGIRVNEERYPGLAFRTVVSNGLVLDKNGNKMSKRLGNVVNPFETIETFGADATRWYLVTNASPWDNLKFDLDGIREVQRKFFGTLYNTYQFFVLYANVDGFAFKENHIPIKERPEIDQWILSSLNSLIKRVTVCMDDYEPTLAGRAIEEFVDEQLSNWYVRLCRRRFWKGEYEHDKICAYQTLYECLETLARLMAPVSPFFSDAVFQNLNAVTGKHNYESVHHILFPVADESGIDTDLEERMQLAQNVSSLILSLRKKVNIKVRQPLQKALIPLLNARMKDQLLNVADLVKSEVNIKELDYITDTEGIINKKIKANYKSLGSKLGPDMKEAASVISRFTQQQIAELESTGYIELALASGNFQLSAADVEIMAEDIPGWSVTSKGNLTVALDITISDILKKEGYAREFVNRIQNIRKESGFALTDRIFVQVLDNEEIKSSLIEFKNYICAEILADSLDWMPEILDGIEIEVNDILLKARITKKG